MLYQNNYTELQGATATAVNIFALHGHCSPLYHVCYARRQQTNNETRDSCSQVTETPQRWRPRATLSSTARPGSVWSNADTITNCRRQRCTEPKTIKTFSRQTLGGRGGQFWAAGKRQSCGGRQDCGANALAFHNAVVHVHSKLTMSSTPIPTRINGRIWDSDVKGTPATVGLHRPQSVSVVSTREIPLFVHAAGASKRPLIAVFRYAWDGMKHVSRILYTTLAMLFQQKHPYAAHHSSLTHSAPAPPPKSPKQKQKSNKEMATSFAFRFWETHLIRSSGNAWFSARYIRQTCMRSLPPPPTALGSPSHQRRC